MKQRKWLCLLLALLLLLSGCGGEKEPSGPKEPEKKTEEPTAGGETAAAVTSVIYDNDTALTRFICGEDGQWHWTDDMSFPLDQSYPTRILELLAAIEDVAASKVAVEDAPGGEAEEKSPDYGLSDSHRTLTVTDSEQQEYVYQIGKCEDGVLYLGLLNEDRSGGTVCCTLSELMDLLDTNIFSMAILPVMPALTEKNVESVRLGSGSGEVILQGSANGWVHAGKDVTAEITELLAALSALQVDCCVDFTPSPGAVDLCGLREPRAVVGVTYVNEVSKEVEISVRVGADRDSGGVFITLNGEPTVYQVSESAVEPLLRIAGSGL